VLGAWAIFAAPAEWAAIAGIWALIHFFLGSLSTTLYSHRLITHNATKKVSLPVHLFFCVFGQIFSVQGSVRRWSANHALHHGVDRHGKKELDPYSATWFPDAFRNFVWSHTLTHLYNHPESEEYQRAHNAKRHAVIMWQDKYYGLLTTFWLFLFPMGLGFALGGWLGFFALMAGSMVGSVLVQHNTWTVNSVTHMWGWTKGLKSSAVNNYVWLGPLGEGNHHGDHHDFPRDYRNGFGWSGWLLDPTRYFILLLRGLRLVGPLNSASLREETEIFAARKLANIRVQSKLSAEAADLYDQLEARVLELRKDWLEAVSRWESLRKESKLMQQATARRNEIAHEIRAAKAHVEARKEEFFAAVERLHAQMPSYAN
jgi:stearoyl-CoA desaturase (delta-9 desaturase)